MANEYQQVKIAITNSSTFGVVVPEYLTELRQIGDVVRVDVPGDCHGQELAEAIQRANIVISSGTPQFDRAFFEARPDMLLVARHGIGYNNVDVDAARKCGCYVTNVAKPAEREAVAELAVSLIMSLSRNVEPAHLCAQGGGWLERGHFMGIELKGRTLGIVGCGSIGTRVAEILHNGFGMKVLICDPVSHDYWAQAIGAQYVSLQELAEASDVITIHASLNKTSYHLLDTEFFAHAKPGLLLVNTARGDIIYTPALVDALDKHVVAAFGADALSLEPPSSDDVLMNHPNTLITPHVGAYTLEAVREMGRQCVENATIVARGERPKNIVNGL